MSNIRYKTIPSKIRFEFNKYVANGCGGKGGWLNPPDFIFTASCNHHDFNYWLGGTEVDRIKADLQFYEAMIRDANEFPWYRRAAYKFAAWVYYKAVRLFASSFFSFSKEPRTMSDLLQEIENGKQI